MPFRNRAEAGRRLAAALDSYAGRDAVVLALPRGGVPVAAEIAAALHAPLDLVLVRKIGAPGHEEFAMGAVAKFGAAVVVRNEDVIRKLGVDDRTFAAHRDRQLDEIERRRLVYVQGRPSPQVKGRVAIVVDDGVATGATTRAALRAVRAQHPAELVLATPVAPTEVLAELGPEADEIVCLEHHEAFGAVGFYYADFSQVSDQEVIDTLSRHSSGQVGAASPYQPSRRLDGAQRPPG